MIEKQDAVDIIEAVTNLDAKIKGALALSIKALPDAPPQIPDHVIKELTQMSNALDCQIPCSVLFSPEGWCSEHCTNDGPQEDCWRMWAEHMVYEELGRKMVNGLTRATEGLRRQKAEFSETAARLRERIYGGLSDGDA